RNDVQDVRDYLRSLRGTVANDQRDIIKSFHSLYTDEYKSTTLKHFREGRIKILLSTEAAGMGCDIDDVVRVIQFKEPSTISCLVQRFGRAARDVTMQGHAILLTSHRNKAKGRIDKANCGNTNMTTTSTPTGDPDIKKFIETTTCRRQILNNNHTPPTPRIAAPTPAHLALARRLILSWRSVVYRRYYMNRDLQMMEAALMDDNTVAKLAKKCKHVTGRESLRSIIKWRLHNKHDSLLAKLLIKLNEDQRMSSS
ncbi:ATP-dependent DNA helicase sgs1, partial [Linnemannia schmuckeri]